MSTTESNNKRIAKNTLYLYVRMFIMMAVGLFTSRVVLDALGAENYGINNVVGGVIVLFSFVNAALTTATQRFLNFYLGRGQKGKVNSVFCMSMNFYLMLAVLIIILAETVGLWFLNTYLNIPEERMWAARVVYQLTIVQFVVNMLRIPYNASIIAYERMDFYAWISLVDVVAKLAVVYLLYVTPYDRLISYSLFYTIIPILVSIIYKAYCNRMFTTTTFRFMWEKEMFKEMFGFTGWQLSGGLANVLSTQGLNIILNLFHGVTLNAAAGVANQVSGHVYAFVSNFQVAFQPQIVKNYAAGKTNEFHELVFRASKFSYLLLLVLIVPLMFTLDKILSIWLVEVPPYTYEFCQLIFVFQAIDAMKIPFVNSVDASGKIRTYKLVAAFSRMLNVPLSYFLLWLGMEPYSIWWSRVVLNLFDMIFILFYVKYNLLFSLRACVNSVLKPILLVTLCALPFPFVVGHLLKGFWMNLLIVGIGSFLMTCLLAFLLGFSANERKSVLQMVKKKFCPIGVK